jgi:hypothetical protein
VVGAVRLRSRVGDARQLVITAGACPLDQAGGIVAPGDVVRQTVAAALASR